MEIVWEVLFLLQANFIVCISGTQLAQKGRGGEGGKGEEIPSRVPRLPLSKGQEEQLKLNRNNS